MPAQKEPTQEPVSTGKRLAFVVGNNGKPGRDALKYATHSAQAIANVLQATCGFELLVPPLLGDHATTQSMKDAIYDLVDNRTPDDFLLFYFCGHGEPLFIESEQRDVYLVSQNFDPKRAEKHKDAHISFRWLSKILYEETDAGTVLVILDCCYAGNAGYQQEEQPLEALKESIQKCFDSYLGNTENEKRKGIRITIATTSYNGTTTERDGYSLLVRHLLPPLRGEPCGVANDKGQITFERLVDYLRQHLPEQPSISNKPIHASVILATFAEQTLQARRARQQAEQKALGEQKLRAFSQHVFSDFLLQNRLKSFVGREPVLNDICQHIEEQLQTGGYLAIVGEAGQGKSSIIAKLVDLYRTKQDKEQEELVIYHFIPFNAGNEYQVVLLKHLMARLILKYHLPTFYIDSDSLPTLHGLFPSLLREVAGRGGREIIFLDGLDQLQEDATGTRDANLLPSTAPPEGIVFVIGTRPNALRSLKRHAPFYEYPLQALTLYDFKLILHHRKIPLELRDVEILYDKLEANALFLDLAAKELAEHRDLTPDEIIKRISDNPENLFSLSLERIGCNNPKLDMLWKRVIKPVLGVLFTAHEPVERTHLKQLINLKHKQDAQGHIDSEELESGLERLGGLVVKDSKGRLDTYSLFHLKFRDYLRRDENKPDKDFIFDADDEQQWHSILATWCEGTQLDLIWQDIPRDASEQRRRLYARQYYVAHLYDAGGDWQRLYQVLNESTYGKAKVRFDLSARAYALDLQMGQKATTSDKWSEQEAIEQLPLLWSYTLLRSSLASKADNYPKAAFELMLTLGQETKALGLAELLTDAKHKVEIFLLIATHFTTLPEREIECKQLFLRTQDIALTIQNSNWQVRALSQLGQALAQAQQWEQAQHVIASIQNSNWQAWALTLQSHLSREKAA